jgi:hypothetical protein
MVAVLWEMMAQEEPMLEAQKAPSAHGASRWMVPALRFSGIVGLGYLVCSCQAPLASRPRLSTGGGWGQNGARVFRGHRCGEAGA